MDINKFLTGATVSEIRVGQSVLAEHSGAFDEALLEPIARSINEIMDWHEFLHGNDEGRVRGIFEKMIDDFGLWAR